jgi:hypothetical protein
MAFIYRKSVEVSTRDAGDNYSVANFLTGMDNPALSVAFSVLDSG